MTAVYGVELEVSDLFSGEGGGSGKKNDFWTTEWIKGRFTEFRNMKREL